MKKIIAAAILGMSALAFVGCSSSHEEGVKSTYRSQSIDVTTDTDVTTEAARAVLEGEGLKNVTANSTKVDGTAKGSKADGTGVHVAVEKKGTGSSVSVTVGTLGDPALGAELAKKIKTKAEASTTVDKVGT